MSFAYFNAHTHHITSDADTLTLVNVHRKWATIPEGHYCSIGIHPWYVPEDVPMALDIIARMGVNSRILAIGECGLDTQCSTPMDVQEAVFKAQVQLANRLQRPLIIHCVRAYEAVCDILEACEVQVPVLFHGFHKKGPWAEILVQKGYYLSFGAVLLRPADFIYEQLASLPLAQLFLETDDKEVDIKTLYAKLAEIRKTELESIILQLQLNRKKVFGI